MSQIESQITEDFLTALGETESFDEEVVDRLRRLLSAAGPKVKPDDVVKALESKPASTPS